MGNERSFFLLDARASHDGVRVFSPEKKKKI